MDVKTGNVVSDEQRLAMIASGERSESDFMRLKKTQAEPEPFTPVLLEAGTKIEFSKGITARVVSVGRKYMTCKMVGKYQVPKSKLGEKIALGNVVWEIVKTGKEFRLKKISH